eukprot:SAG11_NODE_3733_length_2258_cov_1.394627_2_plen_174_part_00
MLSCACFSAPPPLAAPPFRPFIAYGVEFRLHQPTGRPRANSSCGNLHSSHPSPHSPILQGAAAGRRTAAEHNLRRLAVQLRYLCYRDASRTPRLQLCWHYCRLPRRGLQVVPPASPTPASPAAHRFKHSPSHGAAAAQYNGRRMHRSRSTVLPHPYTRASERIHDVLSRVRSA